MNTRTDAELLTALELLTVRTAEYRADVAKTTNDFDAYWAGSATASVMRDYRAGRVVTVKAGS